MALTLRALGGLSTEQIARAFLVSEETMKRRLSRAKAKIKATGIPFAVPAEHLLPDRLDAVLAVIYLIYNEGYSGRVDLAAEAIRLGRVLPSLMPDEPEAHGLLALMMLHHARRRARFAPARIWCCSPIRTDRCGTTPSWLAGRSCSTGRSRCAGAAQYVLQAAIAVATGRASRSTGRRSPRSTSSCPSSPVRRWSSSTARSPWPRPARPRARSSWSAGLELDTYPYLHSTRAELLRRLGRPEEARAAYERALELTGSEPERRFLSRRLAEL